MAKRRAHASSGFPRIARPAPGQDDSVSRRHWRDTCSTGFKASRGLVASCSGFLYSYKGDLEKLKMAAQYQRRGAMTGWPLHTIAQPSTPWRPRSPSEFFSHSAEPAGNSIDTEDGPLGDMRREHKSRPWPNATPRRERAT